MYGLLSYYRKFIRAFSRKCKPISTLMKGEDDVKWTIESESALNTLLNEIAISGLAMPVYDQPFYLTCDFSYNGVGGVLS